MHVQTVGWRPDGGKLFSFLIRVETTGNCSSLRGEPPRRLCLTTASFSTVSSWQLRATQGQQAVLALQGGQDGAGARTEPVWAGGCSWVTPTEAQSISHKHCHEQPGISMARNSSRQLCQLPYGHLLLTPASTRKVPVCMKSWVLSPKSADCFGSMSGSDQAWAQPRLVCASLLAGTVSTQQASPVLDKYTHSTPLPAPRHDVCC